MKILKVFRNEEFGKVRTTVINSEPMFCLTDVCKALGIGQPSKVRERLNPKGVNTIPTLTSGGTQQLLYVNESNLYKTIFQSRKPNAERFTDWVTSEVLPSIRQHGGYIANQGNLTNEELLANAVLVAQSVIKEKDRLLTEQKPKVLFAEAVENSDDVILVKEMANIISQRGFEIGQNQLFQFLRDNGYLCKKDGGMYNLPTKRYQHFFKVTKRIIQNSKGTLVKNTPKITGKGQMYFVEKFDEFLEQGLTIRDLLREGR